MTRYHRVAAACFLALAAGPGRVVGLYNPEARIESARLYGNVNQYAYYYADLFIGTPKSQRVSVIVDTGSSVVAFPCKNCDHCGQHKDPLFDARLSKSSHWLGCRETECNNGCKFDDKCSYSQSYAEGSSITGLWFDDLVRLGDTPERNPAVRVQLGCHTDERKLFYSQRANGIMGLLPETPRQRPTILENLFGDKKHVDTAIFAMCLAEWGGRLTVGGINSSYHYPKTLVQWIPLKPSSFYAVNIANMSVLFAADAQNRSQEGVRSLSEKHSSEILVTGQDEFGQAIVDSGTTHSYFPKEVTNRMSKALRTACGGDEDRCGAKDAGDDCWLLTRGDDSLSKFPVFLVGFEGGVEIRWPPQAYLFRRSVANLWCPAFSDNTQTRQTVLGISFMMHKDIVFDIENARLGVVEATCPEYRRRPDSNATASVLAGEEQQHLRAASKTHRGVVASENDSGFLSTAAIIWLVALLVIVLAVGAFARLLLNFFHKGGRPSAQSYDHLTAQRATSRTSAMSMRG